MMKIRYNFIKNTVNSLFINLKIVSYPIDILAIFKKIKNCRVVPYSKHMEKYNLNEEEVFEYFGSDEGCTIYDAKKERYLVFYNDLSVYYKIPARRRWTLAHELGHILLNHLTMTNKAKIFRNNLTDEDYGWIEAEANRFASLLLANPIILYKLNIKSATDLIKICKLSLEAAQYRFNDYLKWVKNNHSNRYDLMIVGQFHDFIYRKHCLKCGHDFVSENAKYCPICGNKKLLWGDGNMKYDGFELDENGRALTCPNCENIQMEIDGVYCKICGTYLINKCTNENGIWEENDYGDMVQTKQKCGLTASGNARYCEYCGEPTTFYKQGLLKDWQEVKPEIEKALEEAASVILSHDGDIPF